MIVRPSLVELSRCHGPAANAMRYVLIGSVSANRVVTRRPAVSADAAAPLATTDQPAGDVSVRRTRALRSGWSKQGKSWLASAGTSSV